MTDTSESAHIFKIPSSTNSDNGDKPVIDVEEGETEKTQPQKSSKQRPDKNLIAVPLPYKEPEWGCMPPPNYSFEIIKNGTFVSTVEIKSSYFVFGRLQVCDVIFEHPSVSRYHAILQYCKGDEKRLRGFYLYDLGSTHGTFLNKEKITPHVYYKLKVGYVLKFGGSSRLHIFQGPEEEDDVPKLESDVKVEEKSGCNWGMGEDADQEEALGVNPFAITTDHEDMNFDDPKKTLKAWFEREGYEVEYDVEEKGTRTFMCSVKLPVDTPTGEFLTIAASVTGKKKEAVVACALEACRTLDNMGLLRQSQQEAKRRKTKKWEENDYYDSDEDTFYDRTGEIEKRRQMRMRLANKVEVDNFQTLEVKLKNVTTEIDDLKKRIDSISVTSTKAETENAEDSLESYMSSLSESAATKDKFEKRKLKLRLIEAEKEKTKLEKLLDIARPTTLPPLIKKSGIVGKRLKSKLQLPTKQTVKNIQSEEVGEEFVEEKDSDSDHELSEKESEKTELDSSVEAKKYGLQFVQKPSFQIKSQEKLPTSILAENDTVETKKMLITLDDTPTDDTTNGEKKRASSELAVDKPVKKNKSKKPKTDVDVYKTESNEYCTWTPPVNQTGDGTTHLNAKFGY